MIKIWTVLCSLLLVTSVCAQDLTIVPNYLNGLRVNGTLLDDLDNLVIGGPEGEAGGDLEGNYPDPVLKDSIVGERALEATGITAEVCGDATHYPVIEWDEDGRGLECTATEIAFPPLANDSVTEAMLEDTAVTPGTCGDSTNVCRITVSAKGRVTAISQEAISGEPTGGIGPEELESTAIVAGECGDATHIGAVTFDEDGRATNCTEYIVEAGSVPDAIEAESVKLTPVVETTTCDMSFANHQISPTGTTTCTLPDAASDTVGTYNFYHMNTNNLVIAKTGANKINDVSANMAAVTGPLSKITCTNTDDVDDWRCEVTKLAGYGTPMNMLCVGTNGGTNNSASGSGVDVPHTDAGCALPSAKLTVGTVLKACSMWQVTTGTAPPNLILKLKAGSVTLSAPVSSQALQASDTRNVTVCYQSIVLEAPGVAAAIETAPLGGIGALVGGSQAAGDTVQPVDVDTTGVVTLIPVSQFIDQGTGTNTVRNIGMTVEGAGLLP